jgi:hypothetical protein
MTERKSRDVIERAFDILAAGAAIEPPPGVDRAVRRSIARFRPPRAILRPFLATGLAAAGFLALVASLAIVLSGAGAAENGPFLALVAGTVYLAFGAVASLPVLLSCRRPGRPVPGEVRA